ncbi:MAG: prepilin-type N-terminal cleavage/methylation domain-containing protein [Moraxellaceae bacterium]|nr:prepilin-type N-terminal cleavage/methylation domain-containing protein [Moraxellaceae bacterium]
MKKQQSGFTLVEVAIVLVIIGLLLGGVLKGQELINSAKSKAIVNDFRNTATMIAAYQDRFRALPGDDPSADKHLQNTIAAENGDGDGLIEGNWNSTTTTDESSKIWAHLRRANLASGDGTLTGDWQPRNSEGGRIGVQSAAPASNMNGRVFVCQGNISGRVAQQADTTMDDGNPATGSVRFGTMSGSTLTAASTASGPVADSDLFTACASF